MRSRLVRCARCGAQWSPVTQIPLDTLNVSPPPTPPPPPSAPPPASSVERAMGAATMPIVRPTIEREIHIEHEPAMAVGSTPRWLTAASASTPHETLAIEHLAVRDARPARRNAGPLWLLSVLIIVLAIGAAYVWREPVMRAWPPSIRLYQAFGLGETA
jgi:hypothetical protein